MKATIGQSLAGKVSSTNYTLNAGFWAVAVQTPGAPLLRIVRTATNSAVIAWPYPSTGFALEQNTTPRTAGWTSAPNVPVNVGEDLQVTILAPAGNRFYRLRKP